MRISEELEKLVNLFLILINFLCITITTGEEGTWQSVLVIFISLGIIKIPAWKKYSKQTDYILHWTLSTIWNCKKGSEYFARCTRMCPMLELYFQSLPWIEWKMTSVHFIVQVLEHCKVVVQQLLLNLSTSASTSASFYQCWKFTKETRNAI